MTAPLLTIRQVAQMTGLSTSTINRARIRGELAAVRFGPRATRYAPADVEAWILAHRVTPARPYEDAFVPAPRRRHPRRLRAVPTNDYKLPKRHA